MKTSVCIPTHLNKSKSFHVTQKKVKKLLNFLFCDANAILYSIGFHLDMYILLMTGFVDNRGCFLEALKGI